MLLDALHNRLDSQKDAGCNGCGRSAGGRQYRRCAERAAIFQPVILLASESGSFLAYFVELVFPILIVRYIQRAQLDVCYFSSFSTIGRDRNLWSACKTFSYIY